ncbi:MAG: hypothetical protein J6W18_04560 [Bacteroidaceae bacterium]|nr:hypothetical protein [Bacteroidaceae bacterium]
MEKSKRQLALCGVIAAFCLGSCLSVSDELDLNKEISLDMQIGPGGLSIPLGSLDTLYLDSLIKVDGDNSVLDTLEGGLFGFSMKDSISKVSIGIDPVKIKIDPPQIDPLSTEFDNPSVNDVEIKRRVSSTTLEIAQIDLSKMNLPTFEKGTIVGPYTVPGIGRAIDAIQVPVSTQSMSCNFTYELPEEVKKLNKVWFGPVKNSKEGQKLTLDVDLDGIYNVLTDPEITVKNLTITFPDNFEIAKDPDLVNYIPDNCVDVTGSVFSISMDDEVISGVGSDHKLPVTFYVKNADFSDYSYEIDFHDNIQYSLLLTIGGVAGNTTQNFQVGVNLAASLALADIEAVTTSRDIDIEGEPVVSNCAVSNLDGISKVNVITFDPDNSMLYISISDMDMDPFQLNSSTSKINLRFPSKFSFDDDYCQDENGNDVGSWSGSKLTLDADKAIGHTVGIKVQSLAVNQTVDEEDASITIETEVSYAGKVVVAQNDNVDLAAIDAINAMSRTLEVAVWGKFVVQNAEIETGEMRTDFKDSTEISIDEQVDKTLVMVQRIDLVKPAGLTMNLRFEGVPQTVEELTFSRFTVEFPEFIKIAYNGADTRINVRGNKLVINGVLDEELHSNEGFSVSGLVITGMAFDDPLWLEDGRLVLDKQKVRISGAVTVNNQKINNSELSVITVYPSVDFDEIEVKSVYGKVDPKIDPVHEEVSLNMGDADFFQNENNTLQLSDPMITINLNSTVTIPIDLDLSISSLSGNGSYIAKDVAPDMGTIHLPKCDTTATSRKTTLVIYKKDRPVSTSDDTIFVRMSRLSELMQKIPDKIVFHLDVATDTTVNHYIDLTRELSVSGDYNVSIPLEFDNLYIEYSDTIADLGKSLEDIGDKIEATEMQLLADIESTIPLGITLTAKAYDKNWNELRSIRIDSCIVAAGSDTITKSQMILDVDVQKGGLENLESIIFTAACQSAEGSSSIRKGQWLWIKKMRFKLPQGLKVDLTDSMKDDKDKK